MEVHDSHYYLSRDMETVEPMWWRSHYKTETEKKIDLDQFVMSTTERGRNVDEYMKEMRDNDRI